MRQLQNFFENLMIYAKEGFQVLEKRFGKKLDNLQMILSEDFNAKFTDEKNMIVINLFNEALCFTRSNDRKLRTTK